MAPKPKPLPLLFLLFTISLLAFPPQTQSSVSNPTTSFSLELYSREALSRHLLNLTRTSLALSTLIVSGGGEYFARVGIGSPARQLYVVLDTGSDLNWVQCSPCDDCYAGPVFDPSESSTYSPLPCDSPQCDSLDDTYLPSCPADRCVYNLSYNDVSYSVGDLSRDTFTLGSSAAPGVVFGCGHDNGAVFVGAAGFLGLGRGPLSLASQIEASSFSYCLSDGPSTLDFNSARQLGPGSVTAPILGGGRVDTFYYIGLAGISVGGRVVALRGNGGTIIDSGTTLTRLPDNAYVSLRDAFVELTANLTRAESDGLLETCYSMSSAELEGVPAVSFHFSGGKAWDLPVRNYLIPVDSNGTFCFAFARADSSMSIIGNVQQQGTLVTYDLANSLVGFTPGQC